MRSDQLINKNVRLDANFIPADLFPTDQNTDNFHKYKDPKQKPRISISILPSFLALQYYATFDGFCIIVDSGYRSYKYQQVIWDKNVEENGLEETQKKVAPPGASEHQSGLAFDIACLRGQSFTYDDKVVETDEEVKWLQENAHKFGFILRYPKGKKRITGITFEPWHYRFVGVPLATVLKKENITLEEYHQKIEEYAPLVNQIQTPTFITTLEIYAAYLYVNNTLDNINISELVEKFQRIVPNIEIIPMLPITEEDLLKGLGELSKEQLCDLAKPELIHFIETYCFLGR
ncbi:MAG: M15 family metallopeptidase [Bacilli bacterium]|nr:M15 family metallopeptidase [Bacilli bacterium]